VGLDMPNDDSADLLLLNASNYPKVAIFPYAFVQVSEVARRHGLRVVVQDLLGIPPNLLAGEIERLLDRHRPRAVGMHLRQTDSLLVEDYRGHASRDPSQPTFLPVEATREVIACVREHSGAPVFVGGHGFSSNPESVFSHLEPDLGVIGDPDGFFARFDDVLSRRDLDTIPNLVHRSSGKVVQNAREFYGPSPNREYTNDIVGEVRRFYGSRALLAQSIPVEIMRGCPYSCYFCVEPAVKGRTARVRDLDVVMGDVEFLAAEGIARFWMVCSELNIFGPDMAVEIAERMTRLAEKTRRPLRWHAFNLPVRLGPEVWRTLMRSGFRGGFNTYMSLDEDNLRRGRIPHRVADAIAEYKDVEMVAAEGTMDPDDDIRSRGTLALMFGNAFASLDTVRSSVAALRAEGLLEKIRAPMVIAATRIFEALDPDGERDQNVRLVFGAPGGTLAQPTFEYPRALVEHFGDVVSLEWFFHWLETTVFSRHFERDLDWALFLANATTPDRLAAFCAARPGGAAPEWLAITPATRAAVDALLAAPSPASLRALFLPPPQARAENGLIALGVLSSLFDHHADVTRAVLEALGLAGTLRTFLEEPILDVLEKLHPRFESQDAAIAAVRRALDATDDSLEVLCARFLLFRRNLVLDPRYAVALAQPSAVRLPLVS
jgi:hypothetical protein